MAKKASSSNAKKPINLASRKDDDLNDEEDDIDCDDENAAADDVHSQNEHLTLPVNNNLGTNGSDHLNRRSSHSSSNSNSASPSSQASTLDEPTAAHDRSEEAGGEAESPEER